MKQGSVGSLEKLPASFPYAYDPKEPFDGMLEWFIEELERRQAVAEPSGDVQQDAEQAFSNACEYMYHMVGRGMFAVQGFEMTLGSILIGTATFTREVTTQEAVNDLIAAIDGKTCGTLLKEATQVMSINPHGLNILSRALKARNRLVHGYFERHASNMFSNEGRRLMVVELVETMRVIGLADAMLEQAAGLLLQRKGYGRAYRDALMMNALEQSLTGTKPVI